MADPWESNSIDLNSYLNGGSGLASVPSVQYGAASYGGGAGWDWGGDLSYMLRQGVNVWGATQVQQAANGVRYVEGQPIAYSNQGGLQVSPGVLLLGGVALVAFLASKA